MMKLKLFPQILMLFFTALAFSQGNTCAAIEPFCADDTGVLIFPNTSNGPSAESGIDYSCLGSQPNPAWYYLQIDDPGNLNFQIYQNTQFDANGNPTGTNLDVDFICWGPFTTQESCGPLNLNATTEVDCSFSASYVENFSIPNAQTGEIYILLITNYNGSPGFIKLGQTGGSGSTDCSILFSNLGPDQSVCEDEVVVLDGTTENATTYAWFLDTGNGFVQIPGEDQPTLTIDDNVSGTYQVMVADGVNEPSYDDAIITFIPPPTITPITDLLVCDDEIYNAQPDGFTTTDLTVKEAEIVNGQSNITVTYFESEADAEANSNSITTPTAYTNITPNVQEIFVRLANTDGCYSITSFDLIISGPEITAPQNLFECDDFSNDGYAEFNLTQQNAVIYGSQSPLGYSITYHESFDDADDALNPIVNPSTYTNTSINQQTVFVRLENDNSGCYAITDFQVIVNPAPTAIVPTPLYGCDDDEDGVADFYLISKNAEIQNGQTNVSVTYFETQADAEANINTLPANYNNVSSPNQTIYVRLFNLATECLNYTTLELIVADNPEANELLPLINYCDPDSDGFGMFDIESRTPMAIPNDGGSYTVTYHETLADAENDENNYTSMYENIVP